MNNDQFRRLVSSSSSSNPPQNGATTGAKPSAAPRSMLGARPRFNAPMTGRSRAADLFKKSNGTNEQKKAKTILPKGTKLAAGYIDRTQGRREDEDKDETAQKLKALEEQMKEGEIDEETFEKLRDEITGGDISRTHLVKGLDRRLLERVRRGENVLEEKAKADGGEDELPVDEDDEFDELEKHDVVASSREERVKQGEKAKVIPVPIAGQKRSRDQILAELKAQREAAKAAARPQLGTGFKKIRKEDGPRIEVDEKGREVLITIDEQGNVKRKVKKAKVEANAEIKKLSKSKELPLGADVNVPVFEPLPEEESDGDIFENAGHDFNPLAGLDEDEPEDGQQTERMKLERVEDATPSKPDDNTIDSGSEEGEAKETTTSTTNAPKNYFNDDPSSFSVLGNIKNDLSDPNVIAALAKSQRAENLSDPSQRSQYVTVEEEAKRKRHAAMLANQDRDLEDMDMGFGGSRFDDAEEMALEGSKTKFSRWKGLGEDDDGEDEEGGDKGGKKRKRGPKKKKGDKNSASDVMRVMENQRSG